MHPPSTRPSCLRRVFKHACAVGTAAALVLLLCAEAAAQSGPDVDRVDRAPVQPAPRSAVPWLRVGAASWPQPGSGGPSMHLETSGAELTPSELRFVAEGPDKAQILLTEKVTIYDPVDAEDHVRERSLCRAPCSPELSPGTHNLALKKGYDRSSFNVGSVVIPAGPATIHGTITSRRGWRIGLIGGGAIGWAVGHVTLLTAVLTGDGKTSTLGVGLGVPLMALGVGAYVVGFTIRDAARIEVLPGIQPVAVVRVPTAAPNDTRPLATGDPAGLTLRVSF